MDIYGNEKWREKYQLAIEKVAHFESEASELADKLVVDEGVLAIRPADQNESRRSRVQLRISHFCYCE